MILLMMTDGRLSYFKQTLDSAVKSLKADNIYIVVNDDSSDPSCRNFLKAYLDATGIDYVITPTLDSKSGFSGAINNAWNFILDLPIQYEFVFHLEDDFLFNEDIEVSKMQKILELDENIQQVALRRQPWNSEEAAAGGIIEMHPDSYIDKSFEGIHWLEHRNFFTTNPCLYRRSLCETGWPLVQFSEGIFSKNLFDKNENFRVAYFGARDSGVLVTHIGFERSGHGY
jgi:glycosyltransferase involved in cell wall biosynthesis